MFTIVAISEPASIATKSFKDRLISIGIAGRGSVYLKIQLNIFIQCFLKLVVTVKGVHRITVETVQGVHRTTVETVQGVHRTTV